MKHPLLSGRMAIYAMISLSLLGQVARAEPLAPSAEIIPHQLIAQGETRVDDYYWLRDDSRQNKKVLNYLTAENRYTEQMMQPYKKLRDRLYQEMLGRISPEDRSVPYQLNGYRYQESYAAGKNFALYQRQALTADAPWKTLLDANQRAAGQDYYRLGGMEISQDNQQMAIAEDLQGRRQYRISLREIDSGKWASEVIENTSGDMAWANDGKTLFYIRNHPQTLLPYQVYRHQSGTPVADDKLVYQENDGGFYLSLGRSSSRDFVIITISGNTTSEARLIDANQPLSKPVLFAARKNGYEYYLDHYRGEFYLRSNHQSPYFGLYQTATVGKPWQTLIAPQEKREVEGFTVFRDWLVVKERADGLVQLRQISWDGKTQRSIPFDDASYMAWLGYNPDPDNQQLRYGYSAMTTPTRTYQWDLNKGERTLLKQQEVKGVDPSQYHSERVWINARDGVKVPVSLVYNKAMFKPGHSPLLVYGYGAYGMSMDPAFSANRISLLDRGFVYALIHVRGGGELGQNWYQQGKLTHKPNTFSDFIDATQALIQQGYGQPGRIYSMGGSAGGLLMGAVINQAPQLYNAVVAQVPFVDVLTTMLDDSIPLTIGEYEEWGNPNQPQAYGLMRSYSPYDNVGKQAYPNLLVTSGLYDSQVQYWEPAKWVAKLRRFKQGDSVLLLATDMTAGHGGKSGRLTRLENNALEYSFIMAMDQKTQK
ncbi:S9 family peptidase [Serratia quinivorans]|uniref:S9 family peptidase n=1 Tax=Serratia quinivorans TaxID=137545 RepID=UPI00217A6A5A|nr:S9 family peptidase [Serratia quinivorans]CAI0692828.1 Protease 2 [Serratia quinivorans]CAI0720324.1 Protease 2 [Serratia quinivorans]CAI1628253.1 Protease 2 [Serratia quinivorans]CAI2040196.1 Protease 2 [Serratia quinivorans]CAI2088824.1 Protease 2 [Serratia quinivorans]